MEPFRTFTGLAAPLDAQNVDTDQIIPKQFLKLLGKTGYGEYLFFDWRYLADGQPNPSFELNAPRYLGASILLTKENFGCGSSREHAVWALKDYGIRCLVGPSFADIFLGNCYSNGLLPVALPPPAVEELFREARARKGYSLTVDLAAQEVLTPEGRAIRFEIEPFRKHCLLNGLDRIALTLLREDRIAAYEARRGIRPRD